MERSHETSLRDLLARVHERLSHADKVDSETRRLLIALTRDIERTLGAGAPPRDDANRPGRGGVAAVGAGPDRGGAAGRPSLASLEGFAARFDADHPALAQSLRQLIDFLQKAGI